MMAEQEVKKPEAESPVGPAPALVETKKDVTEEKTMVPVADESKALAVVESILPPTLLLKLCYTNLSCSLSFGGFNCYLKQNK